MDKSVLLAVRLPQREVEITGVGFVTVRGLSRAEAYALRSIEEQASLEVRVLACGMVEPALTPEEVQTWRFAATYHEIEPVVGAILELSGLVDRQVLERPFRDE